MCPLTFSASKSRSVLKMLFLAMFHLLPIASASSWMDLGIGSASQPSRAQSVDQQHRLTADESSRCRPLEVFDQKNQSGLLTGSRDVSEQSSVYWPMQTAWKLSPATWLPYDKHGICAHDSNFGGLDFVDIRHILEFDYSTLTIVKAIQRQRIEVATHPAFDAAVMIKIADLTDIASSLNNEAAFYHLLQGFQITPRLLGHVTKDGQVIGFLTEYIQEVPSVRTRSLQSCLTVLSRLHGFGIVHGDAHDGNCLIRSDGSAVLIDFELSFITWDPEELRRDMDIMSRCIRAQQ